MCIYRCFFFSPSWTSHLHCRTLQEKRGGAQVDWHQASTRHVRGVRKDVAPRLRDGGELETHSDCTRAKITHHITHSTKKIKQGARFTFRVLKNTHRFSNLPIAQYHSDNTLQNAQCKTELACTMCLNAQQYSRRLSRDAMGKKLWIGKCTEWMSESGR